jgi:pyruvate kinase
MWPTHRTKIVCTLGPASASRDVIERLIQAGMNIARLNFSHADLRSHGLMIEAVRDAARSSGRHVAILADLPGPKIRLGELARPIDLAIDDVLTLTTDAVVGDARRVPVSFVQLPQIVRPGDAIYINDGFVQLEVESVGGHDVRCRVVMGGEIRSRKGVNLPGTAMNLTAFTDRDRACLRFALERGVDAVSQSFVETRSDIDAVRAAAAGLGYEDIFVIAKIERERALAHIDGILDAADGIMIARGDLGVETAIERIAIVQKQLARLANRRGKPVITATQMLESMTHSPRPTRAEATDVANAILDGTDCVMLSGESAIGTYPIEAVAMLARIAAVTEPLREAAAGKDSARDELRGDHTLVDLISSAAANTAHRIRPTAVFVTTESGASARSVSRFSIPAWIVALTPRPSTPHRLLFSYGVLPEHLVEAPGDWTTFARVWLHAHDVVEGVVVITGSPSPLHPTVNHRLELVDLRNPSSG